MLTLDCSSRTQTLLTLSAGFSCKFHELEEVLLSLDLEQIYESDLAINVDSNCYLREYVCGMPGEPRPFTSAYWFRGEKAARGPGRAPSGVVPHRLVPLSDPQYVAQLEMMVATLKIPLERRNAETDRTEKVRLWTVTDRTVRTWLNEAVTAAAGDGVTFSVPITLHTFRHSYAMHMLYAGIPLMALQSLMGHKSMKSTEVYTKVFALDVAARHRVQFQMLGTNAVAMLKNI